MPVRIPEFGLLAVLDDLRDRLWTGALWKEPLVFDNVPTQTLEDFKRAYRKGGRELRVTMAYPEADTELPCLVVMPERWGTEQAVLGEDAGYQIRQVVEVPNEVLTADAVGGETSFRVDHPDAMPHEEEVHVTSGGLTVTLDRTEYTFDRHSGELVLNAPLAANDALDITYAYYGEDPIECIGEVSSMTTRVFVVTNNAFNTLILSALVWRALNVNRFTLEESSGIKNLAISREPFSEWQDILPAIGFRHEFALSYMVEQVAGVRQPEPPKELVIRIAAKQAPDDEAIPVAEVRSGLA